MRDFTVTTGPLCGSRKIYSNPPERADIQVPFREVMLADEIQPVQRLYDTSGPYTDPNVSTTLNVGLPKIRERWLEDRKFGHQQGQGEPSASDVPFCPALHTVRRGTRGQHVTQLDYARAGIVTEEMIYAARLLRPAWRKKWEKWSGLPVGAQIQSWTFQQAAIFGKFVHGFCGMLLCRLELCLCMRHWSVSGMIHSP